MRRVPPAGATPGYPIASVANALRLLVLLRDRQVLRLSEAAEEIAVGRSTAHRLLATLQHYEFVRQDPDTRAYVLGPAYFGAAAAPERWMDVNPEARQVLASVHAELDETVHVGVLQHAGFAFCVSSESTKALRTGSRAGVTLPAHCTSGGKALLAELTLSGLAELYRDHDFPRLTPASVGSFASLERELDVIRRQGYATNLGESETDVAAVGRALPRSPDGRRMAVAVSAPASRLPAERIRHVVEVLERVTAPR